MTIFMKDVDQIYNIIKNYPTKYDEEIHCKLILKIMINKGRMSAFCTEVVIAESTFYRWIKKYPLFQECYSIGKMFAREEWEEEGYRLRDACNPPGVIDNSFEHWKLVGWSRFGVSKNSRIKLNLNPAGNPNEHYTQLLKQASEGDFTASEIKQLMEAVNVGLNTHQAFELQKEIDQLKYDLALMNENNSVQNSFANKGIAQKD